FPTSLRDEFVHETHAFGHEAPDDGLCSADGGGDRQQMNLIAGKRGHQGVAVPETKGLAEGHWDDNSAVGAHPNIGRLRARPLGRWPPPTPSKATLPLGHRSPARSGRADTGY